MGVRQMIAPRCTRYFYMYLKKYSGGGYLRAVVVAQIVFSAISIILFAKILSNVGVHSPWAQICVTAYACTTAVVGWDTCILTESLSLSLAITFFYFITQYLRTNHLRDGFFAVLVTELLIFLRPQFLTYWAILITFCILRSFFPKFKQERKDMLKMMICLLMCGVVILVYCAEFQKQRGIFSLTSASTRQDLYVCVDRGYYEDLDDEEIAAAMKKVASEGANKFEIRDAGMAYGNQRVQKTTKNYFVKHRMQYILDTFSVMDGHVGITFDGYANINENAPEWIKTAYQRISETFKVVRVIHAFWAVAVAGVMMIAVWIWRRKMPWVWMALFSIAFSTVIPTYFITNAEYDRTMISVLPYFYCILALVLQSASNYATRKK